MQKLHKTLPRPVVSLPMAHEFNEKVAMDLKQWKGRWILNMIDMWARYTVSVFINRKRPSDIIDAMMTHWIGKFGVMKSVLTDNGGEFNSDEMRELNQSSTFRYVPQLVKVLSKMVFVNESMLSQI